MDDATFIKILISTPFVLWAATCRQSLKNRIQSWPVWAVLPICAAVEYYALLPDPSPTQGGFPGVFSGILKVVLMFAPPVIFLRWLGRYRIIATIGSIVTWPVRKYYELKEKAFDLGYNPSGKKSKDEVRRAREISGAITGVTFSLEDDLKRLGGMVQKQDESIIEKATDIGVSITKNARSPQGEPPEEDQANKSQTVGVGIEKY